MPTSLIAPLVGAGVSLLGGALNSGGETSQATTNTPWEPQGAHLNSVYGKAEGIYNTRIAEGPYGGSTYAHINDIQQGAVDRAGAFASGPGTALATTTGDTAHTLQGGAQSFMNNASNMAAGGTGSGNPALTGVLSGYATGATPIGTVDPALSSALSSAATSGAGAIHNFNTGLTNAASTAMSDPTAQIAQSAGVYANSGYVNDAVAASNADIQHNLGIQNAQADQSASNHGGVNSSRAGMQIAMNSEAAARLGATTEAALRGKAYSDGMATAAGQRTAGLSTATTANLGGLAANGQLATSAAGLDQRSSEFDTTSRLGAATAGLSADNSANSLDASTRLAANGQLGTGTGLGVSAADASLGQAGKGYDLAATAGGLYHADTNAGLTDAYAKWQRDNGYAQSVLDPYARIVGQGFNGANSSTGSGTSTAPSNIAGDAIGGAAMGYGLYDRWQTQNNARAASSATAASSAYSGQGIYQPA